MGSPVPNRGRWGRLAPVVLLAVVAALVVVPVASPEPASSKAKRLPAGFLDAGGYHTCALLSTGAVRCWGWGNFGQLGYGNTTPIGDDETADSVGPVNLGRKAVALSDGYYHSCAILDTGAVRCWGAGDQGRLGYGNSNPVGNDEAPGSVPPVSLGAGRKAVAISAGHEHSCAILDTGKVLCWGWGLDGRLGYGNTIDIGDTETPASAGPVDIGTGRKAVALSAGGAFTCAILDTGAVRCWGAANVGQTGLGDMTPIGDTETPGSVGTVDLGVGRTAVAIAAGKLHACALLDTGDVRCWGSGADGRLGYGNTDNIGDTETPGSVGPVDLGTGRTAVAISAGESHTCAILDTGAVLCWGGGGSGRLGYGNQDPIGDTETPASAGPVNLGAGRTAVAIAAGGTHTCALLDNGRVRCWGEGSDGQMGDSTNVAIGDDETPDTAGPVPLGGLVATKAKPALALTLAPKRDRSGPYRFTAKGKLSGFLADSVTCTGKVVVKAKKGRKAVTKRPRLKFAAGRCTYAVSFRVRGKGKWKVTAKFAGNASLLARTSAARTFRAG